MDFDKAYRDQYLISDASTGDPTVHVGRLFIQGLQSHPIESSLRNFAAGVLRSATQAAEELRAVNSALNH
jgi:hypothetical protein